MNLRNVAALSFCAVGLGVASLAVAQQADQKNAQAQPGQSQAGQRASWQNTDQALATCVAIGNQEEVAIAKFAAEKAKHKDVKEFAAMLVKDHQAFNQKLKKYAPEATQDGYLTDKDSSGSDGNRRASSPNAIQQTAATDEKAGGQAVDFIQLHREVAEECIKAAKSGMSKKDGAEFDECFIGYQIAMHASMKNKLVVFERHVSDDLKQVLAAGVATTEMHMKKAEQIMKKLEDADSSDGKRRRSDDSK